MQYFTFLGVGTLPEGYEEALYSFEDNKEEIHASKYVQSAIIEKFQSDISEVFVFCTEKSYSLGARNIKNEIKTNNSNALPKLGIKANNFSAYGLLISLLILILMKLSRGKVANE